MKTFCRLLLCTCLGLFFFSQALWANNGDEQPLTLDLLFLVLAGLEMIAGVLLIGVVLCAVVLGLLAALVFTGYVPVSTAAGIHERFSRNGPQLLLLFVCTAGGAFVGFWGWVFTSFVLSPLAHHNLPDLAYLLTSTVCGTAGGILLTTVLTRLISRVTLRIKNRYTTG